MEVICFEEKAFYVLIDKVFAHIKQLMNTTEDKWISGEEGMKKLHITSRTTLQKMRDEGSIRFSQPQKKTILYDIDSIRKYLEKHARNTF